VRGKCHPHPPFESHSKSKRPASSIPFVNRFTSAIVNLPLWSLPEGVQRQPGDGGEAAFAVASLASQPNNAAIRSIPYQRFDTRRFSSGP